MISLGSVPCHERGVRKRTIRGVGLVSQVNVAGVVPNLPANMIMGYARQSLQKRERGAGPAGDGRRTVDGASCEKVTCADRRNEISENVKILL